MTGHAIIDFHSHWFPPASRAFLSARRAEPRIVQEEGGPSILFGGGRLPLGAQWFDIERRLAHLDRHNVVHQLLSWPTTLNVEPALPVEDAKALWRGFNEAQADIVRRHPKRFSGLAVLSTADLTWSIQELRRAHQDLGLIGFVLPINALGSLEGAEALRPLFAEAQRRRSHIYLHTGYASDAVPGQPAPVSRPENRGLAWTLAAMHHFSAAVATLAFSDFLDDYPDVTVQLAMLGGAGAAALLAEQSALFPERFEGRRGRFDQLFFDTGAAGQGPVAIAAAAAILGAERILFGSDYAPAGDIGTVVANVRKARLASADLDAVLFGNAARLLARHDIILPSASRPGVPGASHVGV